LERSGASQKELDELDDKHFAEMAKAVRDHADAFSADLKRILGGKDK
jgi:hypothetical protein